MDSARQDPFGARLAPPAASDDQSGLRLRSEWVDEAGHRLDDEPVESAVEASENAFDLLPSLYDGWDDDETIVSEPLASEPSLELDIDVAETSSLDMDIDVAEASSLDIDIDVEVAVDPQPSIEIDLDVAVGNQPREARHPLEVAVALRSDSHLWEGFDGELGVFVATVTELPIGTPVALTLHLTGEPTVTVPATVRFLRDDPTRWPGLGLELDRPTHYHREAFRRFAHHRPSAFF